LVKNPKNQTGIVHNAVLEWSIISGMKGLNSELGLSLAIGL